MATRKRTTPSSKTSNTAAKKSRALILERELREAKAWQDAAIKRITLINTDLLKEYYISLKELNKESTKRREEATAPFSKELWELRATINDLNAQIRSLRIKIQNQFGDFVKSPHHFARTLFVNHDGQVGTHYAWKEAFEKMGAQTTDEILARINSEREELFSQVDKIVEHITSKQAECNLALENLRLQQTTAQHQLEECLKIEKQKTAERDAISTAETEWFFEKHRHLQHGYSDLLDEKKGLLEEWNKVRGEKCQMCGAILELMDFGSGLLTGEPCIAYHTSYVRSNINPVYTCQAGIRW